MGSSDLARLKQQAAAFLPASLLRELSSQIDELAYIGSLAQAAAVQDTANFRRVDAEVQASLDVVSETLSAARHLTEAQRRELIDQVDTVLAHNRQRLDLVHSLADRQIRDTAAGWATPHHARDEDEEFLAELKQWWEG